MRVMEEGRLRITDYEKATEKNRNTPYREQVLRIILENNLQKLLVLNEEQLQRMDISQIRGTTYPSLHGRRHSLPSPSHHSNDLWFVYEYFEKKFPLYIFLNEMFNIQGDSWTIDDWNHKV